jgi:hypothetical protein
VTIVGAESGNRRTSNKNYDPLTYVEADFFGEEDTRSNMIRLVSEKLTRIINIPNMKDHGATGVTGCLKNIAYGSFSNVARTHHKGVSHTRSFVGTLAAGTAALTYRASDHGWTAAFGMAGRSHAPRKRFYPTIIRYRPSCYRTDSCRHY